MKKVVKVFYRDNNGKLKCVKTNEKRETIKYLKSEGYEIIEEKSNV